MRSFIAIVLFTGFAASMPASAQDASGRGAAVGQGAAQGTGVAIGRGTASGTGVVIYRGADGTIERRRGTGEVTGRGVAIGTGQVRGRGAVFGNGSVRGQGRLVGRR